MPCAGDAHKSSGSSDPCSKTDCLLRRGLEESNFPVPKEVCNPSVTIDIAVVDQGVPNVDTSTPDSIINLAPLPMTYHQFHSLFYTSNDQFDFNRAALTSDKQSVWMNLQDPFRPWTKNNDQMNSKTLGVRLIDLISFERQHYYDVTSSAGAGSLRPFNIYESVMTLYEKCLGPSLCWNPCAKVEFEKYIATLKTLFDVGDACSNAACSLTLDEFFSN